MNDFLEFFDSLKFEHGFNIEIYASSIVDWTIKVGFKSTHPQHGKTVVYVENCDMKLAFAMAQVELKKYLLENNGGY